VRIGGAAILPALALLGTCGAGQQPPPFEILSSAGVAIVTDRPGTGERLRSAGMASGAFRRGRLPPGPGRVAALHARFAARRRPHGRRQARRSCGRS
jgi:hypothetical protein